LISIPTIAALSAQDPHVPDGKRLAFLSNRGGEFEIWTINADGSRLRQLRYVGAQCDMRFGRRIAFNLLTRS